MPKEQLHGSISIIKQRLELAANMGKMRAIKHQMPLIPWSPSVTECASTQMPRDSWPSKPALLYWKRVGPHAKLHQQPKPGDWHGNLIVGLKSGLTGTKKPCRVCTKLGPSCVVDDSLAASTAGYQLEICIGYCNVALLTLW